MICWLFCEAKIQVDQLLLC